ncbi:16533_t:CDS:2, partial [Gigaspora rosea]
SHHNWISVTAWNYKYPLPNTETVVGPVKSNLKYYIVENNSKPPPYYKGWDVFYKNIYAGA